MMIFRFFLLLVALASLAFAFPESEVYPYPKDFFWSPVGGTLRLSGTFGELRPDHFHSGVDIKGGFGVPIYAAGDGEVYCIKVSAGGYGNVLYVRHPNGYTTVYAHLQEYVGELGIFLKSKQYAQQMFAVEIYPEPGQFVLKRGQLIGKMGSTGHSFGPHLHFEIRETATDRPINPLLFGLQVTDNIAPKLHEIKLYQLGEGPQIGENRRLPLLLKEGVYRISGDTIRVRSQQIGLALKTYDHMDGTTNWNGIFDLNMKVDGQSHYRFKAEKLDFNQTRYINAHVDYEDRVARNSYYHRCFLLPGNALQMYDEVRNDGKITLNPGEIKQVEFAVRDVAGNTARAKLYLKLDTILVAGTNRTYNYHLPHKQTNQIDNYDLQVTFPKGTFYEDCYMNYAVVKEKSANVFSRVHGLHHQRVPVHHHYHIGIRALKLPDSLKSKAFIAHCGSNGRFTNYGGTWEGDVLKAQTRTLGEFCIMIDTVPPSIVAERFAADLSKSGSVAFRINDNFNVGGFAPDLKFRAEVDGQWILMEHDGKSDRLTYRFDEHVGPGQHQFRLEVSDALGNKRVWERAFKR